ncbi:MAG TPA: hypothetical protein VF017_18390 [Thermoanaerobaculia bacterium]|nr:hypothetical protein [Thermoanaerobaculia bacterium]
MSDRSLFWNGIDAATGGPLFAVQSPQEALSALCGDDLEQRPRGPVHGVDLKNLASSGWGVIFPAGEAEALRQALAPLLTLRRAQAGARYREYVVAPGPAPDVRGSERVESTAERFLADNNGCMGPVDPEKMPYFLLIVGPPTALSYLFQFQLSQSFAVGRVAFPELADYRRYADSVVAAERGEVARPRRVALFGPERDPATRLSADQLLGPLEQKLLKWTGKGGPFTGFGSQVVRGEQATKAGLERLLGGPDTPALLLTASHGVGFGADHPAQADLQGALLCQDWPGPEGKPRPARPNEYFAAADVGDHARPAGLISFHFACYGLGTPADDEYAHHHPGKPIERKARHALVARLPQRLLAHQAGGALAVVGHVERAWSYSFQGPGNQSSTEAFESFLAALLAGLPVGAAMDYFGQRAGVLATRIVELRDQRERGRDVDDGQLLSLLTAYKDARSYAVLGDPAVRLAVG